MTVEEDAGITDSDIDADADDGDDSDDSDDGDDSDDSDDGDDSDIGTTTATDNDPNSPRFGQTSGKVYYEGDTGTIVLDGNYAAGVITDFYNENQSNFPDVSPQNVEQKAEHLREGKTQAIAPTSFDEEKSSWIIDLDNLTFEPTSQNSRPGTLGGSNSGNSVNSTGDTQAEQEQARNPTLEYKQGPLSPNFPSDTPAVGQGSGGSSLLPKPGNSPAGRPDKSNREDKGLPGPGTTSRPNTTPAQAIQNVIDDAKRWSKSFIDDLRDASGKTNSATDGLEQSINDGLSGHNGAVSGLNEKMKISQGTGAPPTSPPSDLPDPRPRPETPFKTPLTTPQGQALQNSVNYRNYVRQKVASDSGASQDTRQALVDLGDLGLDIADESYSDGNLPDGDQALETALSALDAALDFAPGISAAKDLISLATGTNPVTGETVSDFEKAILFAGLFAPSVISGIGKKAIRAAGSLGRIIRQGRKSAKKAESILEAIDNGTVRESLKKLDDWSDSTVKHVFNGDVKRYNGQPQINGGLHTGEGLKRFLGERPDVVPDFRETLNNGVERVKLPRSAYNKTGWQKTQGAARSGAIPSPGCKTLFPEAWDAQKIVDASNKTYNPGNLDRITDGAAVFKDTVDGVTVEVTVREGKIETVYPIWNQ
jgi:hypothetical protein